MNNCSLAGYMFEEPSIILIPWPIGAMLPHVQCAYYIVHALALAKLICAVLYSTRIACEVAWHLSATVFSGSPAFCIYLFIYCIGGQDSTHSASNLFGGFSHSPKQEKGRYSAYSSRPFPPMAGRQVLGQ